MAAAPLRHAPLKPAGLTGGAARQRGIRPVEAPGWPHHRYVAIFVCSFSSIAASLILPPSTTLWLVFRYPQLPGWCPERSGGTKLARVVPRTLWT